MDRIEDPGLARHGHHRREGRPSTAISANEMNERKQRGEDGSGHVHELPQELRGESTRRASTRTATQRPRNSRDEMRESRRLPLRCCRARSSASSAVSEQARGLDRADREEVSRRRSRGGDRPSAQLPARRPARARAVRSAWPRGRRARLAQRARRSRRARRTCTRRGGRRRRVSPPQRASRRRPMLQRPRRASCTRTERVPPRELRVRTTTGRELPAAQPPASRRLPDTREDEDDAEHDDRDERRLLARHREREELTTAAAAAATTCSYAVADIICAFDAPSRSRSTIRTATVIGARRDVARGERALPHPERGAVARCRREIAQDEPERRPTRERPEREEAHGAEERQPREPPVEAPNRVPLQGDREGEAAGDADQRSCQPCRAKRAMRLTRRPSTPQARRWIALPRSGHRRQAAERASRARSRSRARPRGTGAAGCRSGATKTSTRNAYCATHAMRDDCRWRFAKRRCRTRPSASEEYVAATQTAASSL